MNDGEILAYLQTLGWEEHYSRKPYKKYYQFRVRASKGWEHFYLDRSKSNAMLYLHPRFLDWRKDFNGCSGVEMGGPKAGFILKRADMREFPTVKGGTGDDIPTCFPLSFHSRDALIRAIAVIADKAEFIAVANSETFDTSLTDAPEISQVVHSSDEVTRSSSQGEKRSISDADYLDILNRQRENGAAGERIVIDWEKRRLGDCGCSVPDDFVTHTSKENVGAGFDIHSHWTAGHERFIEVKTTASGANYFFMSENEKEVLTEKAEKSYIYIVDLDSSGKDIGTVRTPIRFSETEFEFEPVAYRVRVKK